MNTGKSQTVPGSVYSRSSYVGFQEARRIGTEAAVPPRGTRYPAFLAEAGVIMRDEQGRETLGEVSRKYGHGC